MSGHAAESPRLTAGIDLLRRCGALSFRIGFSPEEDGRPIVWYAVAEWAHGADAAAALIPERAVLRLCEQVIDGGRCRHCGRPTVFTPDSDTTILDLAGCVYAWDPELATFRRSCEGDTP